MALLGRILLIAVGLLVLSSGAASGSPLEPAKAELRDGVQSEETREGAPDTEPQVGEAEPSSLPGARTTRPGRHQVAPGWTVGGSFRARFEAKDDFGFDAKRAIDDEGYLLSQLRLNLEWKPTRWASLFVEAQDARIAGERGISARAVPNTFADDFDLHQGYADFNFSVGEMAGRIRTGRQKFNFGAKRLVASLEWVNTARVWDGVRLTVKEGSHRELDLFASRVVPVNPDRFNDHGATGNRLMNSDFHGIYYTDRELLSHSQIEGYWFLRKSDRSSDHVHTLGGRVLNTIGAWDFDAEAAFQWGEFGGLTHRAAMVHTGAGYTLARPGNLRLSAAYNFATGDDDSTDRDHRTFDNLFPLNHAFYGYMDLFALQNVHNLEVAISAESRARLHVTVAYHAFWLDQEDSDSWYNAGAGVIRTATTDVGSYVGSEFDVTVRALFFGDRLTLLAGYGHFFPGRYVDDTGSSSDADFAFLEAEIRF